jgi:hypothetical protein
MTDYAEYPTPGGHFIRDLHGKTFALWRVLRYSHHNERSKAYWHCKCKCGVEKAIEAYNLTSGRSRGCRKCSANIFAAPKIIAAKNGHGQSKSDLYRLWQAMKTRCYNAKWEKTYKYYGARGIAVCEAWRGDYKAFAAYVTEALGERPTPQHSIDRIDGNGNYEPGNIRWATPKEQRLNQAPHKSHRPYGPRKPKPGQIYVVRQLAP